MAAPGNTSWGGTNAHHGPAASKNIDENTRLFQQYLERTAQKPKMNTKNAVKAIRGGLPPHLLKVQGNAQENLFPNNPRAATSASPSHIYAADGPPDEPARSSREVVASQLTPAASVKPPTWEDNLRGRQMVVPERALPPTPTDRSDAASHGRMRRSHDPTLDSMHPALRRALDQQARLLREKRPVQNPNDSWIAVHRAQQKNRVAQPARPSKQIESGQDEPKADKGKWRPKHSSCWGSQSLPSSGVSTTFNSNDANPSIGSDQPNGSAFLKDIRGSIADELDIVPKANGSGWVNKHSWKDYHSLSGSDDANTNDFKKGWVGQYCSDWVASLLDYHPPVASLTYNDDETHWECDINPMDGRLMSPVDYPQTTVNSQDPNTREEMMRRMTGTAEIRVTMEGEKLRKRMNRREKDEMKRDRRDFDPRWKPVDISSAQNDSQNDSKKGRMSRWYEQPTDQAIATHVESWRVDPREPRIACYLRPAQRNDLPQVLEIYNWEVEHGRQALDAKPLTLQDIDNLFTECDTSLTPLVVAVEGTLPPAPASGGGESALVRSRGPTQQTVQSGSYWVSQATLPNPPSSGKILGFGLVTIPPAGLSGSPHTGVGRFNGKIHLYVEPRSRRRGVGRCLLHRVLRSCSEQLPAADWYKWYDPLGSKACAESDRNPRDYARVFAEVASFKGDPDFHWHKKLLQEMKFLYVNTTDMARKVHHNANGGWLDNTVWQHDCGRPGNVHESIR